MKFAEKTVEEFLFTPGKSFVIPEFQRPYSWQASNVREYITDLEDTINKQKTHYFGTVVFVLDDIDSSSIIDGQQRITTSLLMITAIYHLVKEKPELSSRLSAQDIKEKYLVNRNETNRIKLRTVTTDDMILQKIYDVNGDDSKLTPKEKQSNLFQAYAEFKKYFSTKSDLGNYIDGLGNFEIITIALDARDDNPQRVFESINSTGKPLTDGDKIRNFALMLNNEDLRKHVYKQYWLKIERALTDANKENITDFFRSYIISKRQAVVRMDAVYPEFKKLFEKHISPEQTIEEIDDFYGDVTKYLEFYLFCKFEDDPNEKYSGIKDVVFKMRYIQTELYIPFAMSVLDYHDKGNLTDEELLKVFKLFETYFSRRIVCNIATTSVDRFMASLHKDTLEYLSEETGASYVDIISYLFLKRTGPTRMPAEAEFENAIRNNSTYNQRTAHVNYILSAIDDQSKESETLRHIANGQLKLSIEHVMPQTLSNGWDEELGISELGLEKVRQIHEQYLHTLANLTLTGYNSEYQNYAFDKKKTMANGFDESKLGINKWISSQLSWDERTLKNRQEWWIENLQEVWPMPASTFKPNEPDTTVNLLDDINLKGMGVQSITILGETLSVTTWSEALGMIAEKLYDKNENFYDVVTNDRYLSKFISNDSSMFFNSVEIYDTGLFIDTGTETNSKLRLLRALADKFGLPRSELTAELTKPLSR